MSSGGGSAQDQVNAILAAHGRGDHAQVVAIGAPFLARHPQVVQLQPLLGAAYLGLGDPQRAETAFRIAAEAAPADAPARLNLGIALRLQDRLAEAEASYAEAISLRPSYAEAHYNLAILQAASGRRDAAMASYRQALEIKADHVAARYNLGNLHREARQFDEAIACYEAALAIRADHAEAWLNLGSVLLDLGRKAEAIEAFGRATQAAPDDVRAHLNLGKALSLTGALAEAHAAFQHATRLRPDDVHAQTERLFLEAHLCIWDERDRFAALPLRAGPGEPPVSPFVALPFEDDPARQLARSRAYIEAIALPMPAEPRRQSDSTDRIRIGYFSADFHEHATLHLISGLLREHDRDRFEIRAYGFGAETSAAVRARLAEQLDAFVDLGSMTDDEAAALATDDALDIAIDLKGYTQDARPGLFTRRVAPIQIAYLGYPGSMGAPFIDYLIADPVVIPPGAEADYDEKIIRLPGSYQPNDDQRPIGPRSDDRTALGLPAEGFVFASFNQCYKIGPREFDIWMRLLGAIPGSVLWQLGSNPWAQDNLRRHAAARGIDPARIVFADKRPHAEHLARQSHADLFLDSFAVNAHTTASDALWAGLPVLTLAGQQFAARVAASLLSAIDLPNLIVTSEADYEALALKIARSPDLLADLKARLAANRSTTPLFDTAGYARKIEAAFAAAHQRQLAGLAPEHIDIG